MQKYSLGVNENNTLCLKFSNNACNLSVLPSNRLNSVQYRHDGQVIVENTLTTFAFFHQELKDYPRIKVIIDVDTRCNRPGCGCSPDNGFHHDICEQGEWRSLNWIIRKIINAKNIVRNTRKHILDIEMITQFGSLPALDGFF